MLPVFAIDNAAYAASCYLEERSYLSEAYCTMQSAYGSYISFCEYMSTVQLTSLIWWLPSTFAHRICRVVRSSPQEVMIPIYAWWIVAFVQDEQGTGIDTVSDVVSNSMGQPISKGRGSQHFPIAAWTSTALPFPTLCRVGNDYVLLEAIKYAWRKLREWYSLTWHAILLNRVVCLEPLPVHAGAALSL